MPYRAVNIGGGKFKLWNIHSRTYVPIVFNSKQSALNQGLNYMRYRKEKGVIIGNRVLKIS